MRNPLYPLRSILIRVSDPQQTILDGSRNPIDADLHHHRQRWTVQVDGNRRTITMAMCDLRFQVTLCHQTAQSQGRPVPPRPHGYPMPPQGHLMPPQGHLLTPQEHPMPPQEHTMPPQRHLMPSQGRPIPAWATHDAYAVSAGRRTAAFCSLAQYATARDGPRYDDDAATSHASTHGASTNARWSIYAPTLP